MIAAGSLFTSCIEPVEPAGIYDLREAKARYYDALSKLRAADALLVEAKADLKKADAEYRRAEVEFQNLLNEYQRLVNEAKKLDNEKEAAKWAMEIEELKKQHELNMIKYEGKIAQAQENLRQIMSEIEMAALDLTDAEKEALAEAISRYEKAYAKYLKAVAAVTDAESNLWHLQYEYNNVYDEDGIFFEDTWTDDDGVDHYYGESIRTGVDLVEYYESCVEYYTFYAAYFAEMYEEMKDNSDIAKWAEELEELKAERAEREYNRYQVTKDSVEYMQNVFHDGNIEYGLAVNAWLNTNNIRVSSGQTQYKVGINWITMNKPIAPGEKGFDPYTYYGDEVYWVEGGEVMGIPALEEDGSVPYLKFNYILDDYFTKVSEAGDGTHKFMELDGNDLIINANQMMKEFILGGETETPFVYENEDGSKVTAKYGLEGAYSVLERELVLVNDPTKTPEYLDSVREAKYDLWKGHRDTLEKGMTAYPAYVDSLAKVTAAVADTVAKAAAVKAAKQAAATGNGSLAKASEELIETLNGVISHSDFSTPDSTELVKAIVKFAKAREAYLDYTPYKNKSGDKVADSTMFYYVRSILPSVAYDSIKFSDLTLDILRNSKYGPFFEYSFNPAKPYDQTDYAFQGYGTKEPGFQNIVAQLLGKPISDAIEAKSTVAVTDLNNVAFYNAYKYVPKTSTTPAKITYINDEDYTPKAVAEAEAALATSKSKCDAAKANLQKAIDAYVAIYNKYWGAAVDASTVTGQNWAEKMPLDVKRYTLATFTDPYNLVAFSGANMVYTNALGAVLVSVDPKSTGVQNCFADWAIKPQIFLGADGATPTDFYNYMYAEYEYQMATAQVEEVLAAIAAWIDDVKAAFKANADYADAVYKATKDNYDKYAALFKELTGSAASTAAKDAAKIITSIAAPSDYVSAQVTQTQTGAFSWEGKWNLGGVQKEYAEKYMPGFPEKLAAWRSAAKENEDEIGHLKAIIDALEDAYMAAIGVVQGVPGSEIKTAFKNAENYYKDYLQYLKEQVEICLANISWYEDAIAEAEAGYNELQIEIEVAELKLAYAQQKLTDAEIELEVAEAYYNKVMTAILGKN